MESNKLRIGVTTGGIDGYTSSERSSSESPRSASSSSTTSTNTIGTSIGEHYSGTIASPPTSVSVSGMQYAIAELRVMADLVSQARKTGELPPTTSSPLDSEAIIHDHNLLAQLRLARGDPALPPPGEYTRLRVEAARRIRERDARLGDDECKRAAAKRVEGYLRVVGQERRYYELAGVTARGRGDGGQEREMELITEEIVEVVERGIGTTAESLDLTASELDSAARLFNRVAGSLGGTANMLDTAASGLKYSSNTLNSTAVTLESTLAVMATQISTLNAQLLTLTDILRSQRSLTTPAYPTCHAKLSPPQQDSQPADLALEDLVRRGIAQAIREVAPHIQTAYCPETSSVGSGSSEVSWGDSHYESASDDTAVKGKTKHRTRDRRGTERRTSRRARKYVGAVIDKILR